MKTDFDESNVQSSHHDHLPTVEQLIYDVRSKLQYIRNKFDTPSSDSEYFSCDSDDSMAEARARLDKIKYELKNILDETDLKASEPLSIDGSHQKATGSLDSEPSSLITHPGWPKVDLNEDPSVQSLMAIAEVLSTSNSIAT